MEDHEIENEFPLPFCLMFVGYQLVLLIDRVIMHKLVDHGHHHHGTKEEVECKIQQEVVSEAKAKADLQHEIQLSEISEQKVPNESEGRQSLPQHVST